MPPGLTFEPESGAIAGTPASAALALLTVTATDATGRVAHRELEFRVSSFPGELAISSPVGYWRLSDLSGVDASGRGNTLAIGDGSQRRDGTGGRDGALQLAPGASAVAAGQPVTAAFSVELLFEWQKGPGAALVRRDGWSLTLSDDGVLRGAVTTRAGTVTVASLRPVRLGRVTHAVLNCDGRTLGLFLDGDLLGASPVANVTAATGPLTLGPAQADSGVVLDWLWEFSTARFWLSVWPSEFARLLFACGDLSMIERFAGLVRRMSDIQALTRLASPQMAVAISPESPMALAAAAALADARAFDQTLNPSGTGRGR